MVYLSQRALSLSLSLYHAPPHVGRVEYAQEHSSSWHTWGAYTEVRSETLEVRMAEGFGKDIGSVIGRTNA